MLTKDAVVLTGAAMLESIWELRHSDILDLITPFVLYAIAAKTTPGNTVDTKLTAQYVRDNYGYPDFPESVVIKILNRNPHKSFERANKTYILAKPLDSYIEEINRRRADCEQYIEKVSLSLSEYLNLHCTKAKSFSPSDATITLHSFFSRYALFIGSNRLEQQRELTPKDYEVDYYIARYIIEKKKDNAIEYRYILSLIKGYYLQTAVYLQPENGNLTSANYSNVEFYYDTPFLLDLLGYQSAEAECAARNLHNMLKRQKAKCFFFPHTETEVTAILTAYQRTLEGKNNSWRTLDGLDRKKYTPSSVDRLIHNWPRTLEASFGVKLKSTPEYTKKSDGSVDESVILDEIEIRNRIKTQAHSYSSANLDRDMESVLAIHRLRNGFDCTNIESSKAIFVTNNVDLAKAFNIYYKENVNKQAFPPIITALELSAIAWIKSGSVDNIPETQLLVNAYTALQPIPELLERFSVILDQMESEGKLSADAALAMRTSHYVKKELWQTTFGDKNKTNEDTILSLKEKYDQQVLRDRLQAEEFENKRKKIELYHNAESQALDEGRVAKQKLLTRLRKISKIITFVMTVISLAATIYSWGSLKFGLLWLALCIVNIFALYDVWKAREKTLDAFLVRLSNHYETKVIERKKEEYLRLIDKDSASINVTGK